MSLLRTLINELSSIKNARAELAKQTKELTTKDAEITTAILDELENNGFTRVEADGCLVSISKKPVAKVVDKTAFCNYVFNSKNTALINTRISSTLLDELASENEQIDGIEMIDLVKLSFKKGA
jgi:ribosomal protein S8